jgi:hypothetical protein
MPAVLPLEIDQGTVWRRRITLHTATMESNEPLDLTDGMSATPRERHFAAGGA